MYLSNHKNTITILSLLSYHCNISPLSKKKKQKKKKTHTLGNQGCIQCLILEIYSMYPNNILCSHNIFASGL